MKNLKFALSFFTLFLFIGSGFSQSAKMLEKAEAKTEKLNAALVSVDAALALDEDQTKKITDLYVKLLKGQKDIKNADGTAEAQKEKKKALNKEVNQEINKTILSKEQRQALKAVKAKAKE